MFYNSHFCKGIRTPFETLFHLFHDNNSHNATNIEANKNIPSINPSFFKFVEKNEDEDKSSKSSSILFPFTDKDKIEENNILQKQKNDEKKNIYDEKKTCIFIHYQEMANMLSLDEFENHLKEQYPYIYINKITSSKEENNIFIDIIEKTFSSYFIILVTSLHDLQNSIQKCHEKNINYNIINIHEIKENYFLKTWKALFKENKKQNCTSIKPRKIIEQEHIIRNVPVQNKKSKNGDNNWTNSLDDYQKYMHLDLANIQNDDINISLYKKCSPRKTCPFSSGKIIDIHSSSNNDLISEINSVLRKTC